MLIGLLRLVLRDGLEIFKWELFYFLLLNNIRSLGLICCLNQYPFFLYFLFGLSILCRLTLLLCPIRRHILRPLIVNFRFWWHSIHRTTSSATDHLTCAIRVAYLGFTFSTLEKPIKWETFIHIVTATADKNLRCCWDDLLEGTEITSHFPTCQCSYISGSLGALLSGGTIWGFTFGPNMVIRVLFTKVLGLNQFISTWEHYYTGASLCNCSEERYISPNLPLCFCSRQASLLAFALESLN